MSFKFLNIPHNKTVAISSPALVNLLFSNRSKGYVKIVKPQDFSTPFVEAKLQLPENYLNIYVHGINDWISKSLITTQSWESGHLKSLTYLIIRNRPNLQFIDLGCNLGVFTLIVANLGIKVVAVDPNIENVKRLISSVKVNNLNNFVTVLLNGIYSQRKRISLKPNKTNIGAADIFPSSSSDIWSIYLDDIRYLLDPTKAVVIKIDIQGSEIEAFKRADKLFNEFKVGAILMEWDWIKDLKEVSSLINFFTSRSYLPYEDFDEVSESLKLTQYKFWPYDIVWRKKGILDFL